MHEIIDVLLDDEDKDLIALGVHITNTGYAYVGRVAVHDLVLGGRDPSMTTDHINGNTLDNRKANLRRVTRQINQANRKRPHPKNTSGVRGVTWHAQNRKWQAQIVVHGKTIYLGTFGDLADAAHARAQAEIQHYGERTPTP